MEYVVVNVGSRYSLVFFFVAIVRFRGRAWGDVDVKRFFVVFRVGYLIVLGKRGLLGDGYSFLGNGFILLIKTILRVALIG